VISPSHDRTAVIWCAATGERKQTFKGHKDMLFSAVFSADEAGFCEDEPEPMQQEQDIPAAFEKSSASEEEEEERLRQAFRQAYTDNGKLKQGLGVTRDAVATAQVGVEVGFKIAEQATSLGFGIARGILGGLSRSGVPVLSQVTGVSDKIVGAAHQITDFSQKSAQLITQTSLTAVDKGLEFGGGEKYEGVKLLFGEEETDAMIAVADAAAHFPKLAPLATESFNKFGFITGLVELNRLQRGQAALPVRAVAEVALRSSPSGE